MSAFRREVMPRGMAYCATHNRLFPHPCVGLALPAWDDRVSPRPCPLVIGVPKSAAMRCCRIASP